MKLFKTFAATAAVATMVMFSGCQDAETATDEQLADKGITKKTIELYNTYAPYDDVNKVGYSGLDAVLAEGIRVDSIGKIDGKAYYSDEKKARVDFKALNSLGRATTFGDKLVSLNGTVYASVDQDEFEAVTKSIRRFQTKLKDIADDETKTSAELTYNADKPYFVAKLGNDRGYVLAKVEFETDYAVLSTDNPGRAIVNYYYISNEDVEKYSN